MKIGIDAARLRARATGVARYTEGILGALEKTMPDATFVLYAKRECSFVPPSPRWVVRLDKHPIWSRIPVPYWIRYRIAALVKRDAIDLFWTANSITPKGLPNIVPSIMTIYDFRYLLEPENLPPIICHAYRKWLADDIRTATRIVAISAGTSMRMEALFGRAADAVALPAVPALPVIMNKEDAATALLELGVRQPFLITVGGSPCKNLFRVVDAVILAKARGGLADHQVVMVGRESRAVRAGIKKRAYAIDWIRQLGYVDDSIMAALYFLADALVFPSSYEGFGMPVYEARAVGCRVITTESPELREAGGPDATYVHPTPEGIAAGLETALARPSPPVERTDHGWGDAAEAMAMTFRSVKFVEK